LFVLFLQIIANKRAKVARNWSWGISQIRCSLSVEHSYQKGHISQTMICFHSHTFLSEAMGSLEMQFLLAQDLVLSCHGIVCLQEHDVTLQNQYSLMGISTALGGISFEGQWVVEGLEGNRTLWE
jgi:hypothetical protein